MFYKTRRGCKVVSVEPFAVMSGHENNHFGISRLDTDSLLFCRVGTENYAVKGHARSIAHSSDITVVHNFTNRQIVKVDTTGIRTQISPELPAYESRNSFMFSNSGAIPDNAKKELERLCMANKTSLRDHVAILKFCIVTGANETDARAKVELFDFPERVKRTILTHKAQPVVKGTALSFAYEFMLVYLVHKSEFDSSHSIVESQTQVCLTHLAVENSYGHPLDMRSELVDVSAVSDPYEVQQPIYMNALIVYHQHEFEKRYINTNGCVSLVPQVCDTTRPEGFHLTFFRIEDKARGMSYNTTYVPFDKMTEVNGFYPTAELARLKQSNEQASLIVQELTEITKHIKGFKVEALKEQISHSRSAFDKMLQQVERSYGESRAYAVKRLAEQEQETSSANKTIEKLQEELRDNRRTHETAMQTRKEYLETIRLIPPLLGVIAAIMAFKKKNQQ